MAKNTCAGCRRKIVHFVCNDPDRCTGCYEPLSNVVLSSIKCKCMQPRMPRHLMGDSGPDRPTPQVRYGN